MRPAAETALGTHPEKFGWMLPELEWLFQTDGPAVAPEYGCLETGPRHLGHASVC